MGKLCAFKTILLVCVFALAVPLYAFADEYDGDVMEPYGVGEWDYKGEENIGFIFYKSASTYNYYATDGGNFKIDITSSILKSNFVTATIYINGKQGATKGVGYTDGDGTIQFSSIPKGAKVWFYITVTDEDTINFKFYD